MTNLFLRRTAVLAAATVAVGVAVAAPATAAPGHNAAPNTTTVRLIGLNDFHGNLEPPTGSSGRVVLSDGTTTVDAGGAAFLATHVRQLRAEQPNSLVLSGGDNIGASPLASALFHDEPTIEFLNSIGTSASAVGNHELDEGYQELLRIQSGGCHPVDGCQFHDPYPGAQFPYLASNITFTEHGAAGDAAVHHQERRRRQDRHHRRHPQGPADDRVAGRHPGPLVRRRGGRDQPVLDAAAAARRQGAGRGDPPG